MNKIIYIGPTIDGVAISNTIYDGKPPDTLKKAVEQNPFMAGLIIPISELAAATSQIEERAGAIYKLYNRAQKKSADIQKGVNNQ